MVDDGSKDPFDDFRLILVDNVSFVLVYAIPVDDWASREFAFRPGLIISTHDFLGELLRIVFAISLKN